MAGVREQRGISETDGARTEDCNFHSPMSSARGALADLRIGGSVRHGQQ